MRQALVICAGAALLSGCAHGHPYVGVSGSMLAPAKTFTISQERPPVGVEPAVGAALTAQGLRQVGPDQGADYLVDVSLADRPGKMGAYVPGATPTAVPSRWLKTGAKGAMSPFQKGAMSLRVEVVDTATGKDVRQVEASQFYWRAKPAKTTARLADAVVAALKTP